MILVLLQSTAIIKYCKLKSVSVTRSGIVVSMERTYLACSPDDLVEHDLLVEVQCLFTARNKYISNLTVPYLLKHANDAGYCLKDGHDYYYQIQGQMYITKRKKCHLVVNTLVDSLVVDVLFDDAFTNNKMLPKLDKFFELRKRQACFIGAFFFTSRMAIIH